MQRKASTPSSKSASRYGRDGNALSARSLVGPRHLPELKLLDLARRGLGQLREDQCPRAFIGCEVLPAPGDEVLGRHRLVGLQLHEGAGRLAPFLVRHGYDGSSLNGRVLVERILHLNGGDVL